MARRSREERANALRQEIHLFVASLSGVYRTCGKPNCACAHGERHRPY